MFLIIGLGNVGSEYFSTRHNVGFMMVDHIANRHKAQWNFKAKFNAQISSIKDLDSQFLLCKPATYMNLSGIAVQSIASFYKVPGTQIIVIHDDIDLALGRVVSKFSGGAGGHNGLKSIDKHIGPNYHRIRIGIGRPENVQQSVADYVLSKFTPAEASIMFKTLEQVDLYIQRIVQNTSIS